MTKQVLVSLSFLCLFSSCSNTDESVSVSKIGSDKVYTIHLNEIKDSLVLYLADMIEDFEFIPLETKEECMVSWGKCYITNEYILFDQWKDRILQFDRSGKYVRTLMIFGRGPREYTDADWTVDEENQILYISDIQKQNYILRFDLHTGNYLGDLRKASSCSNGYLHINPDQSLMVIPTGNLENDGLPSYIYWQNLNGQLIDAMELSDSTYEYGVYPSFYPIRDVYRYYIRGEDTVFTIKDRRKIPFMLVDFGQENPPNIVDIGYQSLQINFETNRWLSLANHIITENPGGTNPQGPMEYYILDKKAPKLYFQGNIFFDPTQHRFTFRSIESLTIQPNGLFNFSYQAIALLEHTEKALADPEFKEPYRSQLEKLVERIDENANPVLLVGKIK